MGKLFGSMSFQRSRLIVVILRMPRTLFLRWLALCSLSSCILSPISVPSSEKLSDAPRDCDAKVTLDAPAFISFCSRPLKYVLTPIAPPRAKLASIPIMFRFCSASCSICLLSCGVMRESFSHEGTGTLFTPVGASVTCFRELKNVVNPTPLGPLMKELTILWCCGWGAGCCMKAISCSLSLEGTTTKSSPFIRSSMERISALFASYTLMRRSGLEPRRSLTPLKNDSHCTPVASMPT